METNAVDLLLLPLFQGFVMSFAAIALVQAVLNSACRWWHRPIGDNCESYFETLHLGE